MIVSEIDRQKKLTDKIKLEQVSSNQNRGFLKLTNHMS